MDHVRADAFPELIALRRRATYFFVALLWLHLPLVICVAAAYHTSWVAFGLFATALAASATLAARYQPDAFATRATIAVALSGMAVTCVYGAQGAWQTDLGMYFFVVIAMLATFCDWRPVAISAAVASLHPLLLNLAMPAFALRFDGGLGRIALHAALICVECGVSMWSIAQIRTLLRTTAARTAILSQNAATDEPAADQRAEVDLRHTAFHDDLTGLRSRSYFMQHLAASLERGRQRPDVFHAVLFLDLDRFKLVNDSLGHSAGDLLLVCFAQRLVETVRPGDTVARLGSDEFTVLLDNIADASQAIAIAERIARTLDTPFMLADTEVFCSASIGIAISTNTREHADELLLSADSAMYAAKRISDGGGGYVVYEEAMHVDSAHALNLQNDLRRALERNEFRLYYQPIVALDTGDTIGFEALIRWQHPDRGVVSPLEFISAAEQTGLIVGIGAWVLREACTQMRDWDDRFGADRLSVMSINVSSVQLRRSTFCADLQSILDASGVDPAKVQLEITESVLLDDAELVGGTVARLRAMGMRIAFDDFGTGYSSLSYLQRYPVDVLKIDQSFVRGDENVASNAEFIKTIVAMGRTLRVKVVVEGVETSQQLEMVRALGCSSAQGYFFARPIPPDQVPKFIATDDSRRNAPLLSPIPS